MPCWVCHEPSTHTITVKTPDKRSTVTLCARHYDAIKTALNNEISRIKALFVEKPGFAGLPYKDQPN